MNECTFWFSLLYFNRCINMGKPWCTFATLIYEPHHLLHSKSAIYKSQLNTDAKGWGGWLWYNVFFLQYIFIRHIVPGFLMTPTSRMCSESDWMYGNTGGMFWIPPGRGPCCRIKKDKGYSGEQFGPSWELNYNVVLHDLAVRWVWGNTLADESKYFLNKGRLNSA